MAAAFRIRCFRSRACWLASFCSIVWVAHVRAVGGPLWGVGVDGFILFVDDRIGRDIIQIFAFSA